MSGPVPREAPRGRWGVILPFAIFAGLAGLFWFALQTGDPSKLPSALIGKPVPEFVLPPLEGLKSDGGEEVQGFAASDLATGAPTIVNVFASWCVPCIEEHPMLMALAAEPGIRIYAINYKDDPASARRFLGRYGNPFLTSGHRQLRPHRHRLRRLWRTGDLCDLGRRQDCLPPCRPSHRRGHHHGDPATIAAGARDAVRLVVALANDQIEGFEEVLPLRRRQAGKQPCVGRRRGRLSVAQGLGPLSAQFDGVGPAVILGPAALDQPAAEEPGYDIRKRRTIDAGALHQIGLGQPFLLGDGGQHRELPRRQAAAPHLIGIDIRRALPRAMQQVGRRAI